MSNNSAYRPDIDGLRAFAVISVIIYHAFPSLLPGGFVGVDIFFVISGYVITLANREQIAFGTFSWKDFFFRRVRRLLPALAVVLAASLVLGFMLLSPYQTRALALHSAAGLLFIPNLIYWSEAGYFDAASSMKPLLHLWSLGIEEQFYLLWPILALSFGRSGKFIAALAILVAVSFSYSVYAAFNDPVAAYYSPLSRLWELGLGCILAMTRVPPVLAKWRSALTGLGALGLVASCFLIRDSFPFPGVVALAPTLSAASIIWLGKGAASARLLSASPIVFVGKISYPLYLWHWPLLFFSGSLTGSGGLLRPLAAIAATVALSVVTHLWVERPVRSLRPRLVIGGSVMAASLLLCSTMAMWIVGGTAGRYAPNIEKVVAYEQYEFMGDGRYPDCWLPNDARFSDLEASCFPASADSIVIWGDSHAARLAAGMRSLAETGRLGQLTRNSCAPVVLESVEPCYAGNKDILEYIIQSPPDVLILYGAWANYLPTPDALYPYSTELVSTLIAARDAGVNTIVLAGPGPKYSKPLPNLLFEQWEATRFLPERVNDPANVAIQRVDQQLSQIARDADVEYFSTYSAICDGGGCLTSADQSDSTKLMTWDTGHFTTDGAALVSRLILHALDFRP